MDILVVDDDPEVLDMLKAFLEENGHSVARADSAQKALEKIRERNPRLVFLDVRLPDQDGIDLLKTIKSGHPQTAVVMMTGFKEAELVVDAFRQGAMDCILKPFNLEYLKLHVLSRMALSL